MPRGRKKSTDINAIIAAKTAELERVTEEAKKLKAEIADLEARKEDEQRVALADAILKSGKTVDEVMAFLKG